MEIAITNTLNELQRVREFVDAFRKKHTLTNRTLHALHLVAEELVVNTISHGFPDGKPHRIDLRLQEQGSHIVLTMEDDGIPFNPSQAEPPDLARPLHERAVGGLGLHLVRTYADEISSTRKDNRNCLVVRLTKRQ